MSSANRVGANKREVGSRGQTIPTTCSLPKLQVIFVPEKKIKPLISVFVELAPAMESSVEGKQLMNARFQ